MSQPPVPARDNDVTPAPALEGANVLVPFNSLALAPAVVPLPSPTSPPRQPSLLASPPPFFSSSSSHSPSSTAPQTPIPPVDSSSSKRCGCSSVGSSSCSSCSNRSVSSGSRTPKGSNNNKNNNRSFHFSPQTHVCSSPGASALLNSASSSCSSGSKDQRERATLSCVGRHQSMWWGTTHSNMRKRGGRADGAISNRSERKPYNTSFTSQLSSSIHCIPSHCNLVSFTSLSPFLSPSYITYAKGDDTVYSRVGGSLAENR